MKFLAALLAVSFLCLVSFASAACHTSNKQTTTEKTTTHVSGMQAVLNGDKTPEQLMKEVHDIAVQVQSELAEQ